MRPVYRTVFVLGLLGVAAGVLLGIYESVSTEKRLPAIKFDNLVQIEQLMADERYGQAVRQLRMTLDFVPHDRQVTLMLLGQALLAQGELPAAAAAYRQALEIDPALVEARIGLGVSLARADEIPAAADEFEQALTRAPDSAEARQNLELIARRHAAELDEAQRRRIIALLATGADTDPAMLQGRAYTEQLYRSELEPLHGRFTPDMAGRMTLAQLVDMRRQMDTLLGRELEVLDERLARQGSLRLYVRRARFESSPNPAEIVFALDADQAIAGLQVKPAP